MLILSQMNDSFVKLLVYMKRIASKEDQSLAQELNRSKWLTKEKQSLKTKQ